MEYTFDNADRKRIAKKMAKHYPESSNRASMHPKKEKKSSVYGKFEKALDKHKADGIKFR